MNKKYFASWESLNSHPIPQWYEDCKLGIFIHWGIYSVPAFANPSHQLGEIPIEKDWYTNNPYAEWYANSVRVGEGPTYEHHLKTYGKDFPYDNFADMWKAEKWDPESWVDLFQKAGARYVVLVTKHHDGFCLFPSKYTDFNSTCRGPMRNITGELCEAVNKTDMHMGLYYSGYLNWQFYDEPVLSKTNIESYSPATYEYADFAYNQSMELLDTYHPDLFWNDVGWPKLGEGHLRHLLAHYYNTNENAVVNDRFSGMYHGYLTKEYKSGTGSRQEKWEMTRGLGLSFGFNQMENESNAISCRELIDLLCTTVANNGNMLINVGPRADGTIPQWQQDRLLALGQWLQPNGEAIYGTRMTDRASFEAGNCQVNFTRKDGDLFVLLTKVPGAAFDVVIPNLSGKAEALDPRVKCTCTQAGTSSVLHFEGRENDYPIAIRFPGAARN